MKKLLGIVVLGIFLSGNAYAEETKTFEEFLNNSNDIKLPKEWDEKTGYDAKKIGTAPINRLLKNGWKVIGVTLTRSELPVYHLIKKNELIFCLPHISDIQAKCFKP